MCSLHKKALQMLNFTVDLWSFALGQNLHLSRFVGMDPEDNCLGNGCCWSVLLYFLLVLSQIKQKQPTAVNFWVLVVYHWIINTSGMHSYIGCRYKQPVGKHNHCSASSFLLAGYVNTQQKHLFFSLSGHQCCFWVAKISLTLYLHFFWPFRCGTYWVRGTHIM